MSDLPSTDAMRAGVGPDPQDAASIGAALAAARQVRGLELAQCAQLLTLPIQVLRRLEEGAPGPLDTGLYLRGHLRSYGALLGIDRETLDDYARRLAPEAPPPLVASGRVPAARYIAERYLRAGISIALTVAIAAPLVWFAMHSDAPRGGAHLQPIDAAPVLVAQHVSTAHSAGAPPAVAKVQPPTVQVQQPLLAAMTPFVSSEAASAASPQPAATASGRVLTLLLSASSWVEVTTDSGRRLEYGLLQPGSYSWSAQVSLHVLIGNADAATVTVDGKPYKLKDISANNVARFSIGTAPGNA